MIEIKNYSQEAFATVGASNFLEKQDWENLNEIQKELQDNFEKKQMWRTETEMRVSVLNDVKHPTNASKYWQAVREQAVFFENLITLSFDYRRNLIEIKKITKKIEKEEDRLEKEILQIDLEEALFKKKNMELAAKDRTRELKLWSKIKKELDDNSFDNQDVNTHQLVSLTLSSINKKLIAGDSGSPSEKQNLDGLLITSLKICNANGLMPQILKNFNPKIQEQINYLLT